MVYFINLHFLSVNSQIVFTRYYVRHQLFFQLETCRDLITWSLMMGTSSIGPHGLENLITWSLVIWGSHHLWYRDLILDGVRTGRDAWCLGQVTLLMTNLRLQ